MKEFFSHPERNATQRERYTPTGYRDQMARLKKAWQEATEPRLSGIVDPAVGSENRSAELGKKYREAVREEEEIANDYLTRLAESFIAEPPHDQWGIIGTIDANGAMSVRVPFTQAEIEAIRQASKARSMLAEEAAKESGIAREFLANYQLFPEEVKRSGVLSIDLSHRPMAVWTIMTSARAAEEALVTGNTVWELSEETARNLTLVRDLPDKLSHHKPQSK